MIEFRLRPWRMDDLPSLVKYAANFDIAKNMMDSFPHPYSEQSGINFIEMTQRTKNLILCIEINGEAVGSAGIHLRSDIYKKNAELGYWLAEPFWGKGIISRVVPEMVDKAFTQFDIERLFGVVFGRNTASQRVMEKCGFVHEATLKKTIFKNDQFEDEVIYAMRREQWEKR